MNNASENNRTERLINFMMAPMVEYILYVSEHYKTYMGDTTKLEKDVFFDNIEDNIVQEPLILRNIEGVDGYVNVYCWYSKEDVEHVIKGVNQKGEELAQILGEDLFQQLLSTIMEGTELTTDYIIRNHVSSKEDREFLSYLNFGIDKDTMTLVPIVLQPELKYISRLQLALYSIYEYKNTQEYKNAPKQYMQDIEASEKETIEKINSLQEYINDDLCEQLKKASIYFSNLNRIRFVFKKTKDLELILNKNNN